MNNVLLLIIVAAIAGGSGPPFIKLTLENFQPFTSLLIRFFFAMLVLMPFVLKKHELNLKAFRSLFWVSVVGALNPILLFIALQYTQSSVAPLIYAAIPLMTVVYLSQVRKQPVRKDKLIGVFIGFIGVAFIIILPLFSSGKVNIQGFEGNILIFFAAIAFMMYGFISKNKQQKLHITPIALTFYFCLISFIVAIPFSVYELIHKPVMLSAVPLGHILAGVETGVIATSVFYLAYQQSLKHSSELTAALFTYLQPIFTIIFALLLLGEKITLPFIIGGVLAVIGAQRASKK